MNKMGLGHQKEEDEDSCDEKELEVAATGNLQDKYKRLNQGL